MAYLRSRSGRVLVVLALALLVALAAWLLVFERAGSGARTSANKGAQRHALASEAGQEESNAGAAQEGQHEGGKAHRVVDSALAVGDATAVFATGSRSLADRFARLDQLASMGDEDARHFALQIVNQCSSWAKLSVNTPPVGASTQTPVQRQAALLRDQICSGVMEQVRIPYWEDLLDANSTDMYSGSVRHEVKTAFAREGVDAALRAATRALENRPDGETVAVLGQLLAKLDISTVYTERLATAVPPQSRARLMRFALNLLSCQYGRPCGPDSMVVLSTCAALGACVPGGSLRQVYAEEMLSGQEMRDVEALLALLRRSTGS